MLSEYDLVTEIIDFYEHCSIAQSDYIIGLLELAQEAEQYPNAELEL